MIWVVLFFSIILFLACVASDEDLFVAMGGLSVIACIIAAIFLITEVVDGRVIDQKIAMYTEENTSIERSIDKLVGEYMEFESSTFADLKTESAITLVALYPELKSDELVKTQINTYLANNEKIKELKESKINISTAKWWLYFGG